MKSGITRWKIVPSYRGSVFERPSRGSLHWRSPRASSTKFATVVGACSGMRRTFNVPIEVVKVAVVVMADHPSGLDRARAAGPRFAPRHPKKGRSMVARRVRRSVSGVVSALGAMLLVLATTGTALAVVPMTTVSTDPYTNTSSYHQTEV